MKVERIVGQSSRSLADILRFRSAVYESSYDVRVAVYGSDSPRTVAERVLRALSQSDRFVSTRGYDRARDAAADGRAAEFVDVVRAGLAPDRGLFVSEAMQPMTEEDIARLVPLKYQEKSRRTRAHRTEPRAVRTPPAPHSRCCVCARRTPCVCRVRREQSPASNICAQRCADPRPTC